MKLGLTIAQFSGIIGATCFQQSQEVMIQEVAFDTRTIIRNQGVVFFGLNGANRNGSMFINDAYQKGIRLFVVESQPKDHFADASFFIVGDALVALQHLAAFHRKRLSYPILAVAGSIGKTTVKEWIYHLLTPELNVYRSPKSFNSQIGVAISILELPLNGDLAIIEAAVTKPGEMERLAQMICPEYCVITTKKANFRHEFDSAEAYAEALTVLSKNCKWVIDGDQPSQVFTEPMQALFDCIPFNDPIRLSNARIALQSASAFHNCSPAAIANLPHLANRLETIEGINGAVLINDTYTLDLIAFEASLEFLKASAEGKPTMVCCLLDKSQAERVTDVKKLIETYGVDQFYIWQDLPAALPLIDNHVVLIKGQNDQCTQLLAKWSQKAHSTVVRYDLSALHHNLRQYQQILKPNTQILAMVKAQAYGAGLDQMALKLQQSGVQYLGVAYADEGVMLRQAGLTLPILVMNAEPPGFERCIAFDLEPAIFSLAHLDAFIRTLIAQKKSSYPIHLKLDTGMHRLGFAPDQINQVLQMISAQPEVLVKSVYSHLACADEPQNPMNSQQIELFNACCQQIEAALPYPIMKHLLNSEGAAHFTQAQYDMVRLGIGLFGVNHDPKFEAKLKPVISWYSRISQLKVVRKGECIGYGCTDIAVDDVQIAIIPVGYADGFKRSLSNGVGGVFIDGQYCPTLGRVCMDMIMVKAPKARLQSEVEIIGPHQTLVHFALKADTIPYEILTSISPRVHRTYTND